MKTPIKTKLTIKKIKNRLKIIENEIAQLVEDEYVFKKYKAYIENSNDVNKSNGFLFWIAKNYQVLSVINICKQTDKRNDVESLVNLLEDVKKLKNSFSLDWFIKTYPDFMRRNGEDDFRRFSIKNNKRLSTQKIDQDIKAIKLAIQGARFGKKRQSISSLLKYRHKRGAHSSNDNKKVNVKTQKIGDAIALLEQMVLKYNLLINQSSMETLLASNIDEYVDLETVFK